MRVKPYFILSGEAEGVQFRLPPILLQHVDDYWIYKPRGSSHKPEHKVLLNLKKLEIVNSFLASTSLQRREDDYYVDVAE
ncbi:hypothetical protein AKJ16_DCAP17195 [Drosera capensis]